MKEKKDKEKYLIDSNNEENEEYDELKKQQE